MQPRFSEAPLQTDEDVSKWLKFYEMNAPLTCLSVFISHDPVGTCHTEVGCAVMIYSLCCTGFRSSC